ncbi:putative NRPS-like enzyme [Xylogone sp. PMI_703]|nr:putative NRPS-like enzyme [Xylogone sp. PMI_703]
MERIVYRRAVETPNAIAVIDGPNQLTYAELISRASDLVQVLRSTRPPISYEEPIGILMGSGLNQIISQLAVLLAGGTCVPVEPSIPELRIANMFEEVDVKLVIVQKSHSCLCPNFTTVFIEDIENAEHVENFELSRAGVNRSHILFTSGSTGKPKPVQITAEGIIHLATNTPVTPLLPTDRVSAFNNPGFDLSVFEIWVTLLSGATIVAIPRDTATDPGALRLFLKDPQFRVTVIIITAALFEIIAFTTPVTFKGLRHVLTAGDVANPLAMQAVLETGAPEHLWNTYGPTECVTITSMFEVTPEEAKKERISIGCPVGQMQIYLLDSEMNFIHDNCVQGEICIAGPQQSPGYLNRAEENKERFVEISKSNRYVHNGNVDGVSKIRLYRTGDIGERRSSGNLDFIGRQDNQVKHGGFRIELGEIEKTTLSSNKAKSAVVIRQQPTSNGSAALIAFIVLSTTHTFNTADMIQFLQQRLPSYMVPSHIKIMDKLPLTDNGKVDRRALVEQSIKHRAKPIVPFSNGDSHTRFVIKSLWKELLNISEIQEDNDFIALGASSLQAAWLIGLVKSRLGILITMRDLHENSRLPDLVALLEANITNESGNAPDDTAMWMDDVKLADEIELVPDWQSNTEGRIFITGVTGFVGAFFLHNLMHNPKVKQIACLARSRNGLSPAQRVQGALERYDLWPGSPEITEKIIVLEGDMADDCLGLGDKYIWLANWASAIFHLGAKVNFCESYREHRPSNIIGTRNVLRLAATGRYKSFHYMSSVDAWGPTGFILGTPSVTEDEPLEPHIQALRYDIGYAQSQWAAEGLVRRMRDRGLPVAIYRPGFIIGHSETGSSNPDDAISRIIVGCIQLGTWPRITEQRLEYVTIDYVVNAVMHIASSNHNLGRSYHIVPPDRAQSVSVIDTCGLINEAGYPVKIIDYETWVDEVATKQRPHGPCAALMPLFEERVLGKLTRWESSQYSPYYQSTNTAKALADRPDIRYTRFDTEMLKKFIVFWNRKGFYKI